ncbi:FAD-dependent oxidoreductase [Streptacidiphilus sp. PB12-B1b]|uniref:NAD(P)/FAD-dependent oxidoreductase n=1 Tax=Streptacidiphilus sp. PB12-B1b TaxID=2705012 RepID=UPI0015FB99C0|nr:FAD-dependent oxidoreductase [Streptacidiphilus sp. PB12-B1b]QMU76897.1 FAD-dependent oxidoreductase [Streptacidiphilus sp. PB12-B1b]
MDDHIAPRRVVILGGGFAGLFAVRALRRAPVAVTLVDRNAHHLFQPLLYQCASGILSSGQITQPLRAVLRRHGNVRCLLATATGVDVYARVVHAERADGTSVSLPYDELIVGIGVKQSYFGHNEFAQHAPGMKTLDDALAVRRKIYCAFEMAESVTERRAVVKVGRFHASGVLGVADLAVHPHRVPHRLPEPVRGTAQLGGGLRLRLPT